MLSGKNISQKKYPRNKYQEKINIWNVYNVKLQTTKQDNGIIDFHNILTNHPLMQNLIEKIKLVIGVNEFKLAQQEGHPLLLRNMLFLYAQKSKINIKS